MVTVFADTPPTTPVLLFTVALAVLLLLQVPFGEVLAKAVVPDTQTTEEPVMAAAGIFTAIVEVADVDTWQVDVAVNVYTPADNVLVVIPAGVREVEVKPLGPAQL